MGKATEFSEADFQKEVIEGRKTALIDFWAPWCGPCLALAPTIDELAETYEGRVTVAKINLDDAQELGVSLNVTGIPALFLFKDGEKVNQFVGVQNKETLTAAIEEIVG